MEGSGDLPEGSDHSMEGSGHSIEGSGHSMEHCEKFCWVYITVHINVPKFRKKVGRKSARIWRTKSS